MLLLSVMAVALLSLLGAAGECIGYDRWLKANTVKHRNHSLFRQGQLFYEHIPNWPPQRLRPLLDQFAAMLAKHRLYKIMFAILKKYEGMLKVTTNVKGAGGVKGIPVRARCAVGQLTRDGGGSLERSLRERGGGSAS